MHKLHGQVPPKSCIVWIVSLAAIRITGGKSAESSRHTAGHYTLQCPRPLDWQAAATAATKPHALVQDLCQSAKHSTSHRSVMQLTLQGHHDVACNTVMHIMFTLHNQLHVANQVHTALLHCWSEVKCCIQHLLQAQVLQRHPFDPKLPWKPMCRSGNPNHHTAADACSPGILSVSDVVLVHCKFLDWRSDHT